MSNHDEKVGIILGLATVLVNVGSASPLALTGTVERITALELCERKQDETIVCIPGTVHVEAEVDEQKQFLIMDVTSAILPLGFPLTIAQLTARDVAINLDFVIMILPVEVV